VWIEYTNCVDPHVNPAEYIEFIFACFLLRFRTTTGVDFRPREIHFRHAPPRDLSEHYRIFGAPVLFRQSATRAIVEPSVLRIPQLFADAPTCELLEHHIRMTLKRPGVFDELTVALRRSLNGVLSSQRATLAAVAREQRMSRRGLQRQLAARGTSFREVYRALRYELALTLLSRRELSMNEVADSLGFSELSSFSRAFKKWTGMSPQAYRRKPRG
jgi:AraC-like DNA-binding protein